MRLFLTTVLLLALLIPGLSLAQPESDVPHVRNGASPRDGVQDFKLQEVWRAGDEDDRGEDEEDAAHQVERPAEAAHNV